MERSDNILLDFQRPVLQLKKEGTRGYENNSKVKWRWNQLVKIIKAYVTVERKEKLIATNSEARKSRRLVKELNI